jgi:hypothetical protein
MFLLPVIHAEAGSHTAEVLSYYEQVQGTLHANHKLANEINDVAVAHPKDAHELSCLKCHTEQGFIIWGKKGFAPPAHEVPIVEKPLPPGTALATSCLACHDPMKKSGGGDPLLRFEGIPPKLMAGFQVKEDPGRGGLCMLCHNSNRGLQGDAVKPKVTHHAPHETSQADVLLGENFYFMGTENPRPHAEVENSCVGCHVLATEKGKPSNHTFKATYKSCNGCHDDLDGQKVKDKGVHDEDKLKKAIEGAITSFIQVGLDAGEFRLLHMYEDESEDKDFTSFKGGKASNTKIRYFHGRQSVNVDIGGKTYFAFINVIESRGMNLLETVQGQVIAKAGWNYYMLDHDGSHSVHNPVLAGAAVEASLKKLSGTDFSKLTSLK